MVLARCASSLRSSERVLILALLRQEELYQGKPFSYWLDQLPCTMATLNGVSVFYAFTYSAPAQAQAEREGRLQRAEEAAKIVNRVGGKHLPMLLRRLRSRDFPLKMTVLNWAVKFHLIRAAWVHSADMQRGQALTAITKLGCSAKPIFPQLRALAQDKDPKVRAAAKYALQRLRPDQFEWLEKLQDARKPSQR